MKRWEQKLKGVQDIHISRRIKPHMFGKIVETSLHYFSDASEKGYGQCSHIRLVNDEGKIHCSLLVGKSRVTPKKSMSTPRLELTAAVLSVRMACLIRWKYMKGRDNPADDTSRGIDPRKETSNSKWSAGPAFLWQKEELWPSYNVVSCVGDDDP